MNPDLGSTSGVAVIVKKRFLLFFAAAVGSLYFSAAHAFGQTNWTLTTAPSNAWAAVAASADCSKIIAAGTGGIYYSLNSGSNWYESSAPTNNWVSLASSTNGMLMTAAINGGGIWTSSNAGVSWSLTSAPSNNWEVAACSADGETIIAGGLGAVWISTNSGAQWNSLPGLSSSANGEPETYYGLACLQNGAQLIALSDGTDGIDLWLGNDSGMGGYNAQWVSVASAAQEETWLGEVANGVLVGSGYSWGERLYLSSPSGIGSSPDGSRFVAFEGSSLMYFSENPGLTWIPFAIPTQLFSGVVLSSEAYPLIVIAVAKAGGIYSWNPTILPAYLSEPGVDPWLNGATLSAAVTTTLNNTTNSTIVWFEWGTDTNYGHITAASAISNGASGLAFSNLIAGLAPYTTYHFQALASNAFGLTLGGDVAFATVPKFFQVGTNTDWSALVLSADGRELAATSNGVIYISTNLGATFVPTSGTGSVFAASSNGSVILSVNGTSIYSSTNRASTWTSNSAPTAFSLFAASSSAQNVVAADGSSNVYTSTNFGATWKGIAVPLAPTCLASSADGSNYFFGAVSYTITVIFQGFTEIFYTGWVYGSTNSGNTWTSLGSFGGGYDETIGLYSIACSADGSIIVLTGTDGTLTSTNGGTSLVGTSLPHSDKSAACTADGHQMIVGDSYFSFSVSPDTGTTWFRANLPTLNSAVAGTIMSSADGKTLAVLNGGIYLSLPPPSQPSALSVLTYSSQGVPTLQLTGQAGYTYIVEASTDLVNWVNIATLVNTNGTVTFTDPASTNYPERFYRAVAP